MTFAAFGCVKFGSGGGSPVTTGEDGRYRLRGVQPDTDLTVEDLQALCVTYKEVIQRVLGKPFPDDPMQQLLGGIRAVFQSWNGKRAISYRRIEGIPDDWGTAVNEHGQVTYLRLNGYRVRIPLITRIPVYVPLQWLHRMPSGYDADSHDPLRIY